MIFAAAFDLTPFEFGRNLLTTPYWRPPPNGGHPLLAAAALQTVDPKVSRNKANALLSAGFESMMRLAQVYESDQTVADEKDDDGIDRAITPAEANETQNASNIEWKYTSKLLITIK